MEERLWSAFSGSPRIQLPSRQYLAVRVMRVTEYLNDCRLWSGRLSG
jgi:hypothetical protein